MKIIARKRRLEAKTDYSKRKKLLESGKPRVAIRKSNKYITIQYIESQIAQDKVKYTINSRELMKYGWPKEQRGSLKSLAACYLAGILFGTKVKEKEKEIIMDLGLIPSTKGGRVYAALKGMVEAGLKIKHKPEMFPSDERIIKGKEEIINEIKQKILKG